MRHTLGIARQVHSAIEQILAPIRSGGEIAKLGTCDIGRGITFCSQRGYSEASAIGQATGLIWGQNPTSLQVRAISFKSEQLEN